MLDLAARLRAHGVPRPAELSRSVVRGRSVVFPLARTDSAVAMELVRALQRALPGDLRVIGTPGYPPRLRVMRLISDDEAQRRRADLDLLVADFRALARRLVAAYQVGGEVAVDGALWLAHEHAPHCRFEDAASGVVVEAHLDNPDAVDPYFLLEFAATAGRYDRIRSACREGFHDMCRLLDLAGIAAGG